MDVRGAYSAHKKDTDMQAETAEHQQQLLQQEAEFLAHKLVEDIESIAAIAGVDVINAELTGLRLVVTPIQH